MNVCYFISVACYDGALAITAMLFYRQTKSVTLSMETSVAPVAALHGINMPVPGDPAVDIKRSRYVQANLWIVRIKCSAVSEHCCSPTTAQAQPKGFTKLQKVPSNCLVLPHHAISRQIDLCRLTSAD